MDIDDHESHGPNCIHKQLAKAAYEDLIQAYTHIQTAADALSYLGQLDMEACDIAADMLDDIDWLGRALYEELVKRGSSIVKPEEN